MRAHALERGGVAAAGSVTSWNAPPAMNAQP